MASKVLHTGSTVSEGGSFKPPTSSTLFTAYLGSTGGTATCNVFRRANKAAPWGLAASFTLSGASAQESFLLNEPWPLVKADISAISGSNAVATIVMGS